MVFSLPPLFLASVNLCASLVSGDPVTQNRQVPNFTKLEVEGAYHVELTQGNSVALQVVGEQEDHDDLITEVVNGTLKIHRREKKGWSWGKTENKNVKIYLTVASLSNIEIGGASKLVGKSTFKVNSLHLDLSGASSVEMTLDVTKLDVDESGASSASLTGRASHQDVDLSGASSYKGFELSSEHADIDASGASSARLTVKQELVAEASGASSIKYKGSPNVRNIESSGASSVKRVDD
ncbi:head GIN domain-containing protein [Flexibacter flexilis]|nr:head GIN domain-containing protein [Flexibacter flexilis]